MREISVIHIVVHGQYRPEKYKPYGNSSYALCGTKSFPERVDRTAARWMLKTNHEQCRYLCAECLTKLKK